VLDDHKDGYGIYKLDIDNDYDADLDGGGVRRLPGPPVLRVAFPAVGDHAQFAAVGSSIVAVGTCSGFEEDEDALVGAAFIYDTETGVMVVSPQVPKGLLFGYNAAMAVGQRLYMLESDEPEFAHRVTGAFPGGLHCLAADGGGNNKLWGWKRPLSPTSRWCWSDSLMLPFDPTNITGHAVHAPPGSAHHDIFVSVCVGYGSRGGIFSFSSATGKWTQRSELHMPVVGHAHYDGELDSWVGLSKDGYLCTVNVTDAELEYAVGSEKLYRLDEDITAGWKHVDAKLVPMAPCQGGSKYCLMERLRPDGKERKCLGEGDKCLLRLTSFCLERDKDGNPVTIACRARSYKVSRYNVYFDAQVFWL
jgi:hypothetical protein